jgi:hypothetical protein
MHYPGHGILRVFTNLAHYVRSGDFIVDLLAEARNLNEYPFALGALAHYSADNDGHAIAVNPTVGMEFPRPAKEVRADRDLPSRIRSLTPFMRFSSLVLAFGLLGASLNAQGQSAYTFGTTVVDQSGLEGRVYSLEAGTQKLPNFSYKHPVGSTYTSTLNVWPQPFSEGFPRNELRRVAVAGITASEEKLTHTRSRARSVWPHFPLCRPFEPCRRLDII